MDEAREYIGYVIHYAGERDGGAYVHKLAGGWHYTAEAMLQNRPSATLCIEPVKTIPPWVDN